TLAAGAGLEQLGSWGAPHPVLQRVSGLRDGVSLELIWWPRDEAQRQVDELLAGRRSSAADALVHGVPLRTGGRLAAWQERLPRSPPELAAARIEEAALPWGGFSPRGLLTLIRPGERLALAEWLVDGAGRVLSITYALNRCWEPSSKRLA